MPVENDCQLRQSQMSNIMDIIGETFGGKQTLDSKHHTRSSPIFLRHTLHEQ
jgi:hypothetical protein